jgi:hypothetical protein
MTGAATRSDDQREVTQSSDDQIEVTQSYNIEEFCQTKKKQLNIATYVQDMRLSGYKAQLDYNAI